MASSTAAARLHQVSCAIRERASCGVALLVQPSLAAVGGALLRAVGSMSLSHWCRQLFELERRFSGRALRPVCRGTRRRMCRGVRP
eukprot:5056704-Prymnesium_polylepis.1